LSLILYRPAAGFRLHLIGPMPPAAGLSSSPQPIAGQFVGSTIAIASSVVYALGVAKTIARRRTFVKSTVQHEGERR